MKELKDEIIYLREKIDEIVRDISELKERISKLEASNSSKERLLAWMFRVLVLILLASLGVTYGQ